MGVSAFDLFPNLLHEVFTDIYLRQSFQFVAERLIFRSIFHICRIGLRAEFAKMFLNRSRLFFFFCSGSDEVIARWRKRDEEMDRKYLDTIGAGVAKLEKIAIDIGNKADRHAVRCGSRGDDRIKRNRKHLCGFFGRLCHIVPALPLYHRA